MVEIEANGLTDAEHRQIDPGRPGEHILVQRGGNESGRRCPHGNLLGVGNGYDRPLKEVVHMKVIPVQACSRTTSWALETLQSISTPIAGNKARHVRQVMVPPLVRKSSYALTGIMDVQRGEALDSHNY